ncbi:hypothetical protein V6N13_098841 [Hibiscus sabdariffa]|uniref:CCHC-type domain-containing protein n=1 Tax=Hibiscus sabdariffa TaxID=183260 RepID=A0ABR2EF35_9ROSI
MSLSVRAGKRTADTTYGKGQRKRFQDKSYRHETRRGSSSQGWGIQEGVGHSSCWIRRLRDYLRRDYMQVAHRGQAPVVASPGVCWGCGSPGHKRQDCPLVDGGVQTWTLVVTPQRGRERDCCDAMKP